MPFSDSPAPLLPHCTALKNLICRSTREAFSCAGVQRTEFSLAYMRGIKDWMAGMESCPRLRRELDQSSRMRCGAFGKARRGGEGKEALENQRQ